MKRSSLLCCAAMACRFRHFVFARVVSRSLVTGTTSVDPLNLLKEMGMVAVPGTLNEMLCK